MIRGTDNNSGGNNSDNETNARLRISDNDIYKTADNSMENMENIVFSDNEQSSEMRDNWGIWFKRHKVVKVNLLQWKDMPKHLQFNPYILTGYRPLLSIWGCIKSLFYMHNETINILSHGIPIVYILTFVPSIMPWDPEFSFLSWCHILGSVCPWIGSFFYHLFMNLQCGENVYRKLLQFDMLGIWVSQSFGAIPMLTATVYCFPAFFRWTITWFYCLMSIWGLYKALTAWSPWERRLSFVLPFIMRVLLGSLRATRIAGGAPAAFIHIVLQDLIAVVGGAIGALHIPEKWIPGKVDMYLNSHNIMHVLVVLAVYSMHQATVMDLEWISRSQCRLPTSTIVTEAPTIPALQTDTAESS